MVDTSAGDQDPGAESSNAVPEDTRLGGKARDRERGKERNKRS